MIMALSVVTAPTIPTHGHEDTYNAFEEIYPPELLESLATLALATAQEAVPGIARNDIWVSGFSGGYSPEDLEAVDAAKLARPASKFDPSTDDLSEWGFEGDDSNEANVVGRDITQLRQDALGIGRQMADLDAQGLLTPSKQTELRSQIRVISAKITELKQLQGQSTLPIYFATTLDGLISADGEDNPLAYIGDVPGVGLLALYDSRQILEDPELRVSYKSDEQIRIAGRGADIMRHAFAIIHLVYTDEEA